MKLKVLVIVVAIILAALVAGFVIGRRIDVHTDKHVVGLSDELQEVLYLASLSPSSHNIQSWLIDVYPADRYIEIQVDSGRTLSVVDPSGREMLISLGCYTQTLLRSFEAYGYTASSSYDSDKHRMVVYYEKTSEHVDETLIDRILRRHTDKSAFDTARPVNTLDLDAAIDQVSHEDSIHYYSVHSTEYDMIKEQTMRAYETQAYDADAAEELSGWLRLSNGETTASKDGLPAEQLGITGIKKLFYYLFTNHESATKETFAKQGVDTTQKQLDGCTTFAIITSDNKEEALIQCGQDTVTFWLAMVDAGISVQPMSYAIEEADTKAVLMSDLPLDEEPQMILRLGYVSNYGENAAIRRDLNEYIRVH